MNMGTDRVKKTRLVLPANPTRVDTNQQDRVSLRNFLQNLVGRFEHLSKARKNWASYPDFSSALILMDNPCLKYDASGEAKLSV